ncbi:sporulation protein [Deinococcus peraridilitoris]|uniref:Sporulation control protein n=1 Tax=Deinococcus peraridilitoris (strain DSM 19664 / LMG 22246 / CIP 109416 / KR-200) TaxID=937777 RepID=L0A4L1_DEIPD|nr:sporulation protein [Deinococcus peraridilitoris]AFZ68092.1 sporulation control protein [Deinococcus peraridilitoris DSM 19664]
MGFLRRTLARVGIGNATVDTQLAQVSVRLGEQVEGKVVVRGDQAPQAIEHIELFVLAGNSDQVNMHEVQRARVCGPLEIAPGEERVLPFEFVLSYHTPLSLRGTRVGVQTGVSVRLAVDLNDHDLLEVQPSAPVQTLLDAAELLGLRLSRSYVDYAPARRRPAQQLEFLAPDTYGVKEVELLLSVEPDRIDVTLEVDRRAQGLVSLITTETEARTHFSLAGALLDSGVDAVARELDRFIRERPTS